MASRRTPADSNRLASGMLFILLDRVDGPFRCHLFGVIEEHRLLPLFLPYHKTAKLAMRSEMSFKCRSSTSVESEALAPQRSISAESAPVARNSSAKLLPPNPKNSLGLGIYTSKTCLPPSIITPWPSMTNLRLHTPSHLPHLAPQPAASPVQPRPAYIPYKYQSPRTSESATQPPQRPARPLRTRSFMISPIRKPPAALMKLHLAALNRNDSLSSVYSRSTSGESLPSRSESGRTLSPSSSSSTLGGTRLQTVELATEPEHVASEEEHVLGWDVPSPPVRHSAKVGVMQRHARDTWVESPNLPARAKSASPRKILRKTRESGREHNMF